MITDQTDGTLAVWLPELEIYGTGKDLEQALDDLIEEVELYLSDWKTHELGSSPNHAARAGWVRRLQACDGDRSAVRSLLVAT